jgi:hypothetical protein
VYIAHRAIVRSDRSRQYQITPSTVNGVTLADEWFYPSPPKKTEVRPAGVISLNPEDVYTQVQKFRNSETGTKFAQLAAQGKFQPINSYEDLFGTQESSYFSVEWMISTMNYHDLQDPVPASKYYEARPDCWGEQTHCGTITDGSYRPKLYLKPHLWYSLLPGHLTCEIRVLNDPPKQIGIVHDTPKPPSTTEFAYVDSIPQETASPGAAASNPALSEPTMPSRPRVDSQRSNPSFRDDAGRGDESKPESNNNGIGHESSPTKSGARGQPNGQEDGNAITPQEGYQSISDEADKPRMAGTRGGAAQDGTLPLGVDGEGNGHGVIRGGQEQVSGSSDSGQNRKPSRTKGGDLTNNTEGSKPINTQAKKAAAVARLDRQMGKVVVIVLSIFEAVIMG